MTRFILFLLLPFGLLAQTPDCTQKGALTTATTFTALPNNTGNPICSAFVLVWNSTGFTGVTIQLEGADTIAGSYTAFTAATPFANPTTALSGAIVIQATTKLAFVRVNVSSVTGTGAINFQINGYRGVTPVAGGSGGGGSGTVGMGTAGELAYYMADGTTVIGLPGCTATVASVTGLLCTGSLTSGSGSGVAGAIDLAQGTAVSPGTNAVTLTAPTAVTGYLQVYPAALAAGFYRTDVSGNMTFDTNPVLKNAANTGTSAFTLDASASTVANAVKVSVKAGLTATANGALGYDATANNVHAAQGSADAIAVLTKVTPGNGNCASWLNSGGTLNLGDAGAPCGSSSGGGGIITYSSSADTFLGTQFLPPGGGAPASSTESDVQVASPAAATVSNLHVEISSPLGVGVTAVFTWRDAGSSTTSTCSISGNSAKSCTDTSHSFNAAAGDLLDMQVVTTGTPAAVNVLFTSAFGTSGVGITTFTTTGTSGASTYNASTGEMNVPVYSSGSSTAITPNPATFLPPASIPLTGWTNVNSGVVNDSMSTYIDFFVPPNASLNWRFFERSLQSLSTYTVAMTVFCNGTLGINANTCGAIYLYDGTKIEGYELFSSTSNSLQLRIEKLNSVTSDNGTAFGPTSNLSGQVLTIKVVEDGVHRTWSHWAGGAWTQDLQETTGTFLTPTQFGFGGLLANGAGTLFSQAELRYSCLANTTSITTSSTCL